jgi:hypothetical protein
VTVAAGQAEHQAPPVFAEPERWRDKHGLAEHFACGIRWIEERMAEGMPHTFIAGRAKFKVSRVEPWLDEHGFIEDRGGAA